MIDILTDNLQELYAYGHANLKKAPSLVSNAKGTRVYVSTAGWGRVWTWIYSIVALFVGNTLRTRNLQRALLHTHRLFQERCGTLENDWTQFRNYLTFACEGYEIKEQKFYGVRKRLIEWRNRVHPFLKALKSEQPLLTALFRRSLQYDKAGKPLIDPFSPPEVGFDRPTPDTSSDDPLALLRQSVASSSLTASQQASASAFLNRMPPPVTLERTNHHVKALIDLECILKHPLPLDPLSKLALQKALSKEDKQIIKHWIRRVERNQKHIPVRMFHRALQALVTHLNQSSRLLPAEVIHLGIGLIDHGLMTLFTKDDPKHIRWRDQLQPGDPIPCEGVRGVLGEEIHGKTRAENKHRVFTIVNDPTHVVVIGPNEALLALKKELLRHEAWGIKPATMGMIDPAGRCALVERLTHRFTEYEWDSGPVTISRSDRTAVGPILKCISWWLDKKKLPTHLSPEYIFLDESGEPKSVKIGVRGEFSYNDLEDFIWACAAGNLTVYRYMVAALKLFDSQDQYRLFYVEMVKRSLEGKRDADAANEAGIVGIDDDTVVDRGKALFSAVRRCKKRLERRFRERYKWTDRTAESDKILCTVIANLYQSWMRYSVLEEGFDAAVLQALRDQHWITAAGSGV